MEEIIVGNQKYKILEEVAIKENKEEWSTITLEDGTTIKIKPVILRVVKTDALDENGNPVYLISSQNVTITKIEK